MANYRNHYPVVLLHGMLGYGQQQKTVRTHVELGILHARQLARHHAEEDVPPRHIVRK